MVGDLEKATFSNIENETLNFVKFTLDPWVIRWEQNLGRALFTPEEKKTLFFKFNVDGLLRGDYASRMSGYATGIQNGIFSINDCRELENMDLLSDEEGGNLHILNGNVVRLKDAGAAYQTETETEVENDEVLEMDKSGDNRAGRGSHS